MLINKSKKIVIKLGSSTIVDRRGKFKAKWFLSLIKDLKKLNKNQDIVIVSSGAIALGQAYLKIKKKKIKIEMSQAIAAVGQIILINHFKTLFEKNKIKISKMPFYGENCRLAGEDVAKGKKVFSSGEKINSTNIIKYACL